MPKKQRYENSAFSNYKYILLFSFFVSLKAVSFDRKDKRTHFMYVLPLAAGIHSFSSDKTSYLGKV
jgi:hypothetical protein